MANSCGGADACVPAEIEVAMKDYIRRQAGHREFFDQTDEDKDGRPQKCSCLLEDLGGTRCPDGVCYYNRDAATNQASPTRGHRSKKPIW